jgi:hypothetical protein
MRSFVWVLPLILLVLVVIVAYFLGLAQDKAIKIALNNTGYINKEKSTIERPDNLNLQQINHSFIR